MQYYSFNNHLTSPPCDSETKLDYETSLGELAFDQTYDWPIQQINILNPTIIQKQILPNDCQAYKLRVCKNRKLAAVGCTYVNNNNNNNYDNTSDQGSKYNRLIILDIGNGVDYLDFISDSDSDDDDSDSDSDSGSDNGSDSSSTGNQGSDDKQSDVSDGILEID